MPLDFIDVIFPDEKTFGRANLRVEIAGKAANPENLPLEYQPGSPGASRISFASPWPKKEKLDLTVDYVFAAPADTGDYMTLAQENFHLGTRGWLPVLLPPNHALAPFPTRPPKMLYSVRVPNSFTILARGSSAGRKQDSAESTYHFELNKDDLAPYVVAGQYATSPESKNSAPAIFWTIQALPQNLLASQDRIAATWGVLQKNFGAIERRSRPPYIVESSTLRPQQGDASGSAFAAFPGGVLANSPALGIDSTAFASSVERELARTWFGDALDPAPAAAVALGEGLPAYASIVIDEARGGDSARRKRILDLLNAYDDARKQSKVPEKSVVATTQTDPPEQRRLADAKAPLLFADLEDTCGPTPVRAGLAQAIQFLRGKEVSVNDIRAAIEYTTGKNLAEPFRVWLYNPGIPSSFRTRYAQAAGAGQEKIEKGN